MVELGRFIDKFTRKQCQRVTGCKISKPTFKAICEYWKAKRYRRRNGRAPFIYRLQIAVEVDGAEYDAGCRIRERKKPGAAASDFDKVRFQLQKSPLLLMEMGI